MWNLRWAPQRGHSRSNLIHRSRTYPPGGPEPKCYAWPGSPAAGTARPPGREACAVLAERPVWGSATMGGQIHVKGVLVNPASSMMRTCFLCVCGLLLHCCPWSACCDPSNLLFACDSLLIIRIQALDLLAFCSCQPLCSLVRPCCLLACLFLDFM